MTDESTEARIARRLRKESSVGDVRLALSPAMIARVMAEELERLEKRLTKRVDLHTHAGDGTAWWAAGALWGRDDE